MSLKERRGKKDKPPFMAKHTRAHPGIEVDAKGKPIPVEKRTATDRAAVHRASARQSKS